MPLVRGTLANVERLLADAAIVRHRGKIESTINNARRFLEVVEAFGLEKGQEVDVAVHPVRRLHPLE